MRKSFYKKTVAIALFGTVLLWGWIVYAQPENWIVTTIVFSVVWIAQLWGFYVSGKAAEREKGFANEDGTWPDSVPNPKSIESTNSKRRI